MGRNQRPLTDREKRQANGVTFADLEEDIATGPLAFATLTVIVRGRKIETVRKEKVSQVDPEGKMD